jgi:DNA-binding MarR family transcriptional regulator
MMGGMLTTSILSGQIISRTGRYKLFPVCGTAVMSIGLFLLSRLGASSSTSAALAIMLVLGLGLGMVMQVLVIAVQNAVDYGDLGVATSGATLFRLIGGSLGTAVMGAIFTARLSRDLESTLPSASGLRPGDIPSLPPAAHAAYATAFTHAIAAVFLVAAAVALTGFVISWLLPERPLRSTIAAAAADIGAEMGETFPMPGDDDPLRQLALGLAALADRDVRRQHIERIVARAGVRLSPAAAWLLLQLEREPALDPVALGHAHGIEADRMEQALDELRERGLVAEVREPDGGAPRGLTAKGWDVFARLVAARRERLAELFAEWPAERHEELAAMVARLARELVPDGRALTSAQPAASLTGKSS